MFHRFLPLLLLMFFPLNVHAAHPFVGDWALDREMCDETRLFWSTDGVHGSLMFEDGRWLELASASYSWKAGVMTYTFVPPVFGGSGTQKQEPMTEQIRITMAGPDRLTLENLGREVPENKVGFVRCPPR